MHTLLPPESTNAPFPSTYNSCLPASHLSVNSIVPRSPTSLQKTSLECELCRFTTSNTISMIFASSTMSTELSVERGSKQQATAHRKRASIKCILDSAENRQMRISGNWQLPDQLGKKI